MIDERYLDINAKGRLYAEGIYDGDERVYSPSNPPPFSGEGGEVDLKPVMDKIKAVENRVAVIENDPTLPQVEVKVDTLEADMTEANARITTLENNQGDVDLTEVYAQINDNKADIGTNKTSITTVNNALTSTNKTVKELKTLTDTLHVNVAGIDEELSQAETRLGAAEAKITALENQPLPEADLTEVNLAINANKTEIATVKGKVTAHEAEVVEINQAIASNTASVELLKEADVILSSGLDEVESSLQALNTKVNELDTEVTNTAHELNTIDATVSSHTTKISSLETKASKNSVDILSNTNSISALDTRIEDIENNGSLGAVDSVNGYVGVVELDAADVGAIPSTGGTATGAIKIQDDFKQLILQKGTGKEWHHEVISGGDYAIVETGVSEAIKFKANGAIEANRALISKAEFKVVQSDKTLRLTCDASRSYLQTSADNEIRVTSIGSADGKVQKFNVYTTDGLFENNQRVYSPNNKPSATDLDVYTKAEVDSLVSSDHLLSYINTGGSEERNTALIRTNIDYVYGTELPAKEFGLVIKGNNVISMIGGGEDPDGYGCPVSCASYFGLTPTSASILGSSILESPSTNKTSFHFLKDSETNKLCIGLVALGSLANFTVDYTGGSLTQEELTGWRVDFLNDILSSRPDESLKLEHISFRTPSQPLMNIPSNTDIRATRCSTLQISDGLTKTVISLGRLDQTNAYFGGQSGILSGFTWKVNGEDYSNTIPNLYYTVKAHSGDYKVSCQSVGGFDLSNIRWVTFTANGYPYVGIEIDNSKGGFEIESFVHTILSNQSGSNSYQSVYSYWRADSEGSSTGSILNQDIYDSIQPIDSSKVLPIEGLGAQVATDFNIKATNGTISSVNSRLEALESNSGSGSGGSSENCLGNSGNQVLDGQFKVTHTNNPRFDFHAKDTNKTWTMEGWSNNFKIIEDGGGSAFELRPDGNLYLEGDIHTKGNKVFSLVNKPTTADVMITSTVLDGGNDKGVDANGEQGTVFTGTLEAKLADTDSRLHVLETGGAEANIVTAVEGFTVKEGMFGSSSQGGTYSIKGAFPCWGAPGDYSGKKFYGEFNPPTAYEISMNNPNAKSEKDETLAEYLEALEARNAELEAMFASLSSRFDILEARM